MQHIIVFMVIDSVARRWTHANRFSNRPLGEIALIEQTLNQKIASLSNISRVLMGWNNSPRMAPCYLLRANVELRCSNASFGRTAPFICVRDS
jgi:hypothetical protein